MLDFGGTDERVVLLVRDRENDPVVAALQDIGAPVIK